MRGDAMILGNYNQYLERLFGKSTNWSLAVAAGRLGEEGAGAFFVDARDAFSGLAKDFPDLKSPMNRANFSTAPFALSAFQAALSRMPREEALDFAAQLSLSAINGFLAQELPWVMLRVMRSPRILPPAIALLYRVEGLWDEPKGWVYEFPERRPGELFSVDVTRCGIHPFMEAHGAPELTRKAICPGDDLLAENYFPAGTRLERSTFISEGGPCCAFRFIRGG
ncbi:MAG: L-2-amino-thiazoline-4-carboxylic acid hydrolase [Pseudomonadota bacterium]